MPTYNTSRMECFCYGIRPLVLMSDPQDAARLMWELHHVSLSRTEEHYLYYAPLRASLLEKRKRQAEAAGFGGPTSAFTRVKPSE